jgi:tetratricopeptide (TPR) repeat protein
MDSNELIHYINNPHHLNEQSIYDLTLLADQYPFFQTAQLLRIKNLHNISPNSIEPALNFTAAYVTDRKILYYLLHPIKELIGTATPKSPEKEIKDSMAENISDTLMNQVNYGADSNGNEIEFTTSFDVKKEYGKGIVLDEYVVRITDDGPELMELLHDEKTKKKEPSVDYTMEEEDLLLLINKGVAPSTEENYDHLNENQRTSNKLIDSFIATNPKIVPVATAKQNKDISQESVQENDHYLTDTLAQIYLKQGNYAKAILAYEKLSLKFPEKSTYFAGQIAEIKRIIDKTK